MIRFAYALIVAAFLGLGTYLLGYWSSISAVKPDATVWSTGPTITHLESLAQLVAIKVYIADVLLAEGASYRGSWLIKGDGLISIDLRRARIVENDVKARKARVQLPQPTVLSARIDHEKTKTWSVEKTTWVPWKGDPDRLRDEAMTQAQKLVEFAANSKENIDRARSCAEAVVQDVYRMVDWNVTVEWEPLAKQDAADR